MKYSQEVGDYAPDGLSTMQYGVNILEEILAMPGTRTNSEMMAECLTSIQKSKRLTPLLAYRYMVRAIRMAKEQDITVDRMFFLNGDYAQVRPMTKPVYGGTCDVECQAKHGRGYHTDDVKWVMAKYFAEVKAGGNKTPEYFFKELDSKRAGGPPEWKR